MLQACPFGEKYLAPSMRRRYSAPQSPIVSIIREPFEREMTASISDLSCWVKLSWKILRLSSR